MKPSETPEFRKMVGALGPYLEDLVVVGGWAHSLMTEHEAASPLPFEPLMTLDADVAGREQQPVRGEDLRQRLQQADFREMLRGEDRPPVSEYHLDDEDGGFYVEFLVPQQGSGLRRDGTADGTALLAGVSAQKLRHIDLLLQEPWSLYVDGPDRGVRYKVQFANPVCFVAQKLLVLNKRPPKKRAKDLLYIHDTALLFGDALEDLSELWLRAGTKDPHVADKLQMQTRLYFRSVTDLHRNASIIAKETGRANPPSAEEIRRRCLAIAEVLSPHGAAAI